MEPSLAEKLTRFKPGMLYVGVDLGLDSNAAKVRDEGAKLLGRFSFPHSRDGYDFSVGCRCSSSSVRRAVLWSAWSQPATSGGCWPPSSSGVKPTTTSSIPTR